MPNACRVYGTAHSQPGWNANHPPPFLASWPLRPAVCSAQPERQSSCQLELDATTDSIINRASAVRTPLEAATPDLQLVDTLVPIWQVHLFWGGGAHGGSLSGTLLPAGLFMVRAIDA